LKYTNTSGKPLSVEVLEKAYNGLKVMSKNGGKLQLEPQVKIKLSEYIFLNKAQQRFYESMI